MAQSSSGKDIGYAFMGAAMGAFYFIKGFGVFSHYNTIKNTPTSKVEAVAAGFMEVYGEAIPKDDYLKSPFSGSECSFYTYTIEQNSGNKGSWVVINKGASETSFFIKDETGKIEVDPKGAELDVENKKTISVSGTSEVPENIEEFLKGINVQEKTPSLNWGPIHNFYSRKYNESIIEKGESAFVTGTAVPKEGVLSERHEETLLVKKGDLNKFFYISDQKEKKVLAEMRNKIILYMLGGGAATIICLAYVFLRLGIL